MSGNPSQRGSTSNFQVDINQFPTRDSHLERVLNQTDCSICTDAFENEESSNAPRVLPCSHVFHQNCLSRWLENHSNCPVCRYELQRADNQSMDAFFDNFLDSFNPNLIFSPFRGRSPTFYPALSPARASTSRGRSRSRSGSRSFSNSVRSFVPTYEISSDSSDESEARSVLSNRSRSRSRSSGRSQIRSVRSSSSETFSVNALMNYTGSDSDGE